jgi:hypothetical protein
MIGQTDHIAILDKLAQVGICRRARGAALRGEELDHAFQLILSIGRTRKKPTEQA